MKTPTKIEHVGKDIVGYILITRFLKWQLKIIKQWGASMRRIAHMPNPSKPDTNVSACP